jgi:hypothetical protein
MNTKYGEQISWSLSAVIWLTQNAIGQNLQILRSILIADSAYASVDKVKFAS